MNINAELNRIDKNIMFVNAEMERIKAEVATATAAEKKELRFEFIAMSKLIIRNNKDFKKIENIIIKRNNKRGSNE